MMMGKLDSRMKKSGNGHHLIPYTKINLKRFKDLNVRLEIIKLLKENIEGKLLDTGLGNDFLDLIPEAKATKAKMNSRTISN